MTIIIGDKTYNIEINDTHGKFHAIVNNVSVEVVPEFDKSGQISAISIDGKHYDIRLTKSKDNYQVSVSCQPLSAYITHDKTATEHIKTDQKTVVINSPMSGLVINLPIKIGQEVLKDNQLLTLEAMKMQNDIKSPINAKVLQVFVKVGQTVEKDDKLLVLEPL